MASVQPPLSTARAWALLSGVAAGLIVCAIGFWGIKIRVVPLQMAGSAHNARAATGS